MKILIAFFTIFLASFSAAAVTSAQIDNRLDQANALRQTNPQSAIEPLYNIFVDAIDSDMEPQAARALTYLGWALKGCQHHELAIQAFDYAMSYAPSDDTKLRGLISLGLGSCYAGTGEYAAGEKQLLNSLDESIKAKNMRETMMIYTYLGDLYSSQAKDTKAKEAFEKGRNIARTLNDTIFESSLWCNIGCLEDNLSMAEQALFKSIDLSQQSGNRTTECYAYVNLAEFYLNNGDSAKALRTIEQVNRLIPYIDAANPVIAYSHQLTSSIYAARHEYDKAYNYMTRASKQEQMNYQRVKQERAKYSAILGQVVKHCEAQRLSRQERNQFVTLRVMWLVIVMVLIVATVFYLLYRKSVHQQRLLNIKGREIDLLEKTKSQQSTEIDDTRRKMNYLYGFYRGRALLLEKLSAMIRESYKMSNTQLTAHLRMVNNTISEGLAKDKEPQFIAELSEEENEFVKRMLERYPDMSKNDVILATYYRLGLSTREIARISGKQPATVTTARYRLRTSLNLPEDVDLTEFFAGI
jgi:tetratricopeptide (TPR) repeat protein